jgi:hypothetical protein
MYKQLLGSTNFHKILEQSQTHSCQKADIWQVPYPGPTIFRYPQGYLEKMGLVNPWTTNTTLPTSVYYLHPCTFFRCRFDLCSGDLTWWNVECYLENMKNGVQTLSQFVKDMKSMCTFKTLQSCAQLSGCFADILPA